MLQKIYGSNGLGEQLARPTEYRADPSQILALEQVPGITAYIDTLPHGLIADEL
jgi:hypothetical protein